MVMRRKALVAWMKLPYNMAAPGIEPGSRGQVKSRVISNYRNINSWNMKWNHNSITYPCLWTDEVTHQLLWWSFSLCVCVFFLLSFLCHSHFGLSSNWTWQTMTDNDRQWEECVYNIVCIWKEKVDILWSLSWLARCKHSQHKHESKTCVAT